MGLCGNENGSSMASSWRIFWNTLWHTAVFQGNLKYIFFVLHFIVEYALLWIYLWLFKRLWVILIELILCTVTYEVLVLTSCGFLHLYGQRQIMVSVVLMNSSISYGKSINRCNNQFSVLNDVFSFSFSFLLCLCKQGHCLLEVASQLHVLQKCIFSWTVFSMENLYLVMSLWNQFDMTRYIVTFFTGSIDL